MNFETETDYDIPMPIGPLGNIQTDLMLIALLVKSIEVIEASGTNDYDVLKDKYQQQLRHLKDQLRSKLPTTVVAQKAETKMSDDDKKFVVDTLMGIISGKDKNVSTWRGSPDFANTFGDLFASIMRKDADIEDDDPF